MIAYVSGTLGHKSPGEAIVDVNGLGYRVQTPLTAYEKLGSDGSPVKLFTVMSIRENAQDLFGFLTEGEKTLFTDLIGVNGVGPKLGLSILSTMAPAEFGQAVMAGDTRSLSKISGVGKKTAERLVMELRSRFESGALSNLDGITDTASMSDPHQQAILALASLGYRQQDAAQAVASAVAGLGGNPTTDAVVKEALRNL